MKNLPQRIFLRYKNIHVGTKSKFWLWICILFGIFSAYGLLTNMEMTILQTMVGGFGVTAFLHLFYWTKYQDTPKGRMEKEEKTRKEAHLEQIRKEAYADELGRREAQRNRSHVITEREFETSNSFQNDFNAFLSPVDKSDKEIWFGKKRVRDSIFDKSEFSTSNSRKKKKRKFDDMF